MFFISTLVLLFIFTLQINGGCFKLLTHKIFKLIKLLYVQLMGETLNEQLTPKLETQDVYKILNETTLVFKPLTIEEQALGSSY